MYECVYVCKYISILCMYVRYHNRIFQTLNFVSTATISNVCMYVCMFLLCMTVPLQGGITQAAVSYPGDASGCPGVVQ